MPHGSFLPWIQSEFGMSVRASQRFMQVAESYASKSATVALLDPSALYALASAEPDVQARIEEMIAAGDVVTKATVDELRRRADTAEAGQSAAVRVADERQHQIDALRGADRIEQTTRLDELSSEARKSHREDSAGSRIHE